MFGVGGAADPDLPLVLGDRRSESMFLGVLTDLHILPEPEAEDVRRMKPATSALRPKSMADLGTVEE